MATLTFPIALADFATVICAAYGFFYLTRLLARLSRECGQLASIAFLLVLLGGLSQLLWKILITTTALDLRVLANSFFVLLTPGFICALWAVWCAFRPRARTPVWVAPVIVIATLEGAAAIRALSKGGRGWLYVMLCAAGVAFLILTALLVYESARRHLRLVCFLFTFAAATFLLEVRLALVPVDTIFWQWIAQLDLIFGWAGFAYAVWSLERTITGRRY